jgi:uncharacterized membrane protein
LEAELSAVWAAVAAVGIGTVAFKGAGPVVVGGRRLPPKLMGLVELLAPALLAALVVTQAVGGDRKLVFDARLVGLGAAVVALRLRVPLLAVVVVAAAATALVRAV